MSILSRRRFLRDAAGSALLIGGARGWAAAESKALAPSSVALSGTVFDLSIGALPVHVTGASRTATVVNGQLPAPLLRWRQGDTVTLRVTNHLPVTSSIHWHGMILPADMDGVPGLSFGGIAPGATYVYRFPVNQSGTYWYHAHAGFQEQTGLYGPIVIAPRGAERFPTDREYCVLLSDWSDSAPEHLYATLKRQSDYFNYDQPTALEFFAQARSHGLQATWREWGEWARMRMGPTDLADVSGATYTYLINGLAPAANWTALFRPGERVRLRFINGSAMSFFDVRIPGLGLTVVAADGQDVEPVTVDEFRFGSGEVLDVIVSPAADRPYTIFAQSMDRSGYARGTLSPQPGLSAAVPALAPRPRLTMADMGMAMVMPDMPEMPDMPGMRHVMQAVAPRTGLDDPGVGLRGNGRRVLTYADLHTLGGPIDPRDPGRELELHLTGQMQRYIWSFNGQKFSEAAPLRFAHGERLRLVLVNDTMMTHPIHLHGMWSELCAPDGSFQVRKHTLTVQPSQRVSYLVSADALGRWAFHCHLTYHMAAGMFREVRVESPDGTAGDGT
jgi:CopA family copper-resistance protein